MQQSHPDPELKSKLAEVKQKSEAYWKGSLPDIAYSFDYDAMDADLLEANEEEDYEF